MKNDQNMKWNLGKKVVILGAGIAGLSSACELLERGFNVTLIEKEDQLGGLARTIHLDKANFDLGIHGFFPSQKGNEKYLKIINKILGDDLVVVDKKTAIYFNKKYINYPLGFKDMFSSLSLFTSFLCFVDFLKHRVMLRLNKGKEDDSFKGWICNRFGEKLYNIYFGPFAEKTWGIPPENLASTVLGRRVTVVSIWDVIKKGLLQTFGWKHKIDEEYPQQPIHFLYAKEGVDKLPKAMEKIILVRGGTIIKKAIVEEILKEDDGFIVSVKQNPANKLIFNTDFILSTIPVTAFAMSFNPSQEIKKACSRLRYRALVIVNISVKRSNIFTDQWVYYSSKDTIFTRINEFTNVHESFGTKGISSICVEIPCFEDDEFYIKEDSKIFRSVMDDIEKLNLFTVTDVDEFNVVKLSHAYPIYTTEITQYLEPVVEFIKNMNNSFTIGRQGGFSYINMDEAFKGGLDAAEKIANLSKKDDL